jgi:hypothetical protein
MQLLRSANDFLLRFAGERLILFTLAISSLLFWGLLLSRTLGGRLPVWHVGSIALALLLASLTSMLLTETAAKSELNAVIVASNVHLHAGDGDQFPQILAIDAAAGHRVVALSQRGGWTQVRTADGHSGWMRSTDVATITPSDTRYES